MMNKLLEIKFHLKCTVKANIVRQDYPLEYFEEILS